MLGHGPYPQRFLAVSVWICIEGSTDIRTEGRNAAHFVCHAESLDFQVFFMAILVQLMIFRIFTPCNKGLLSYFRGWYCLHFITCIWPPVHISLLVPKTAILGTEITPLVLQKPYPLLTVPQLLIGQDFLKPSYISHTPSSHYCNIHLQQLVTVLMEAVRCPEMSVHSTC